MLTCLVSTKSSYILKQATDLFQYAWPLSEYQALNDYNTLRSLYNIFWSISSNIEKTF